TLTARRFDFCQPKNHKEQEECLKRCNLSGGHLTQVGHGTMKVSRGGKEFSGFACVPSKF
ncbi:MAG: hypothetical protein ACK56F_29310, partial [bacterium]